MTGYKKCFSVDLRCFNNSYPDYGVGAYLDTIGCTPDMLFNHETYVDQLHTHSGIIDDSFLEPQWTSQRAIPGVQRWTRRQFRGLVDALHGKGIKYFQGAEAAWNYWPEYGVLNRCDYTYNNLSELFLQFDNGKTSADERGCINPLRRFSDGSWYEDLLIRDLVLFLNDYEMDGFFAADGFCGLDCPLDHGDFSRDMLRQFGEFLGNPVPNGTLDSQVSWILKEHRTEWTNFYSWRWASFYRKLTAALYQQGKDLVIFSPWTTGPADSLVMYGINFQKLYQSGVRTICLEVMEEVIGRRWHSPIAWESTGLTAAITIKLQAPEMQVLWTAATANIPEHWHTPRDLPNILEREALSVGTAGVTGDDGIRKKAFDGFLTIFGIDLTADEWKWFLYRTDLGFGFGETANLGLAILWSTNVLLAHAKLNESWDIKTTVLGLQFSGIPVQSGCTIPGIIKSRGIQGFLLIDPIGITDEEVAILECAAAGGAKLLVTGRVDNERLLRLLGIKESGGKASGRWQIHDQKKLWMENIPDAEGTYPLLNRLYVSDGAVPVIHDNDFILVGQTSSTLYIAHERREMPCFAMPLSPAEFNCDRPAFPRRPKLVNTIRQSAEAMASVHPDSLELTIARCIQNFIPELPRVNKGQFYGIRITPENSTGKREGGASSEKIILLENPAHGAYIVTTLRMPLKVRYASELPIRCLGPLGYRYWFDSEDTLYINIPPESCIPIHIVD